MEGLAAETAGLEHLQDPPSSYDNPKVGPS